MSRLFNSVRSLLVAGLIIALVPFFMVERAHSCACCNTYAVVNVAPGDQLNIRDGADFYARWIGAVQPGDCGIMRLGPEAYDRNGALWFQIGYNGLTGWVNSKYIEWIPSSGRSPPVQNPYPNQNTGGVYAGGGSNQPYWCNRNDLNGAEATICSNQNLWSLDSTMVTAYDRARSDSPAHASSIRDNQKGWLDFRNQCGYDANCLTGRYEQRIGYLEGFFNN